MDLTQELVLNYLLENGGKVKNSDLVKTFKPLLESPDPQEKANNRDAFKRYVNKIAVVRDEDGSKMVVLKKKYSQFLTGGGQTSINLGQGGEGGEGGKQPEWKKEGPEDQYVSNVETEVPSKNNVEPEVQPIRTVEPEIPSISNEEPEVQPIRTEVLPNKNVEPEVPCQINVEAATPTTNPENVFEPSSLQEPSDYGSGGGESSRTTTPETESGSLNDSISSSTCEHEGENESERERVFDIVARMDQSGPASYPKSWSDGQPKDVQKPAMLPLRYAPSSSDILNETEKTLLPNVEPPNAPTPVAEEVPQTVSTKSPNVTRKQLDNPGSRSPYVKRAAKMVKVNEDQKYSDVVPLVPNEHEWLVNATNGRWNHKLLGLIMVDSDLASKRDFISGFSALHWAAKSGNIEMVKLLFDLSSKGGTNLNVNVKSFGGYTPLHIAAIHDHIEVIKMLIRDYKANVYIRDNSGRKPYHYLKKTSSMPLRHLLKDPHAILPEQTFPNKRNSKVAASILGTTNAFLGVISDDIAFHDLTRGLKKPGSLNKFFTGPSGAKKKPKIRDSYPAMSSLCEDREEMEEVVGHRRPISEIFPH